MENTKRTYNPGSKWIYYKIYTGPKTADLLLTDLIKPITEELLENNLVDKWFFIRYEDPKFHLRVRFKATNDNAIGKIINTFTKHSSSFIEDDLIYKIQLDSYQREIERYGENTIIPSETLFYYDSKMITSFLNLIDDSNEGEELRWLFAIKAIDTFLSDFNSSEEDKLVLIEKMKINFCEEFHMNRFLKKQLDKKYITNKNKIEHFIDLNSNSNSELKELIHLLQTKSDNSISAITEITNNIETDQFHHFLASHIHMIMNRLFRHKNRLYELVIYYFLFKHYKSAIGRKKHKAALTIA